MTAAARRDPMRDLKLEAARSFAAGVRVPEVSRTLGLGLSTVYAWHAKWSAGGIERLTRWRWTHSDEPLNAAEREVLDGLMLGDGCLAMGSHAKNPCLNITRAAKDIEYLQWTADIFSPRLTASSMRVRALADPRTGKTYHSARLRTRCDPAFLGEWRRWYPGGRKVVAADLTLTSLGVAVWLADDGSVSRSSRRTPEIKFATHGFTEPDVRRLSALLAERYDASFPVYEESGMGQFTIRAFGAPAKALVRDIDPVFPPLARKSGRWRGSELLDERAPAPCCPRCDSDRVYRWARTRGGVRQYKCMTCMRVFRETYERAARDPWQRKDAA